MLKVEAVKIGESPPAPLLTLIVGPSEESREVGVTKKELAERYVIRHRFWSRLLEKAKDRTKLHANISPGQHSYIGSGAGRAGLYFNYSIRKHDATVELYIDRGKDSEEWNKDVFDSLFASKDVIEAEFGSTIEWQRLDNRRACRIMKTLDIGGYRDEEDKWPEIHDAMIDTMIRLEKALRPHIEKLQV